MARTNEEALKALNAAEAARAEKGIPFSKSANPLIPLPSSGETTIPGGIAGIVMVYTTDPNAAEDDPTKGVRANYALLTESGDQIPLSFFMSKTWTSEKDKVCAINALNPRATLHDGVRLVKIPTEDGTIYTGFKDNVRVVFKTEPVAYTGNWDKNLTSVSPKGGMKCSKENKDYVLVDVYPA